MGIFVNNVIGVYGGSFDPVHYGHLRTALEVKEIFGLDQLRLIPCYQSPLKENTRASADDRLAMLRLAVADLQGIICDSRELNREGYSYMVDTLASLRMEYSDCSLLLFIGTDAFNQLTRWHEWQRLFDYAHVIVITRPTVQPQILSDFLTERVTTTRTSLTEKPAGKLFFQTVTQLDISATVIRSLIGHHGNPRFLLPDSVIHYINANKLYTIF